MTYTSQYYPGSASTPVHRRAHHSAPINKDADRIDLYSDRGVLLKSGVDLSAATLRSAAMQRLVDLTTRPIGLNTGHTQKQKRRRGAKGGCRTRPSERRSDRPSHQYPDLAFIGLEKSKAEIRAEKAARRAEAELLRRKAAGTFL